MIAIIQSYCLIYPPVFIKPYIPSMFAHITVFELGYIITHIFKTNSTESNAVFCIMFEI